MTNNIYTFVCDPDECDALVEFLPSDGFGFPNGEVKMTCACGRQMNWISARIQPTNEKEKEEKEMEYNVDATMLIRTTDYTTGVTQDIPVTALDVESMRRKINNLETRLAYHEKMISQVKENLTYAGWYMQSTDKEDVLADLCSIIGHEPVATLRFSATFTVEGSVDVPLSEVDEFDLRYELNDDISIDSHNGNLEIDSFYVNDIVNEEWE
jgi:hypothetical protein